MPILHSSRCSLFFFSLSLSFFLFLFLNFWHSLLILVFPYLFLSLVFCPSLCWCLSPTSSLIFPLSLFLSFSFFVCLFNSSVIPIFLSFSSSHIFPLSLVLSFSLCVSQCNSSVMPNLPFSLSLVLSLFVCLCNSSVMSIFLSLTLSVFLSFSLSLSFSLFLPPTRSSGRLMLNYKGMSENYILNWELKNDALNNNKLFELSNLVKNNYKKYL